MVTRMKHTFFGHTFEKVTDEELNVSCVGSSD